MKIIYFLLIFILLSFAKINATVNPYFNKKNNLNEIVSGSPIIHNNHLCPNGFIYKYGKCRRIIYSLYNYN